MTTSDLSRLSGVPAGTLRMWKARHSFPMPADPAGYTHDDLAAVRAVLALRAEGFSLPAAIERVRASEPAPLESIFAALRSRRPELRSHLVGKRALLALTRAIEDEHLARGGATTVIGSFQRVRHFREAEPRWRELARTAQIVVALADFADVRDEPGAPVELPLGARHTLAREWTLVADGAVLAAWEVPGEGRTFEAVWSFDPDVVADAARAATEVVRSLSPSTASRIAPPAPVGPDLRFASDLANRAFGYLAAELA